MLLSLRLLFMHCHTTVRIWSGWPQTLPGASMQDCLEPEVFAEGEYILKEGRTPGQRCKVLPHRVRHCDVPQDDPGADTVFNTTPELSAACAAVCWI